MNIIPQHHFPRMALFLTRLCRSSDYTPRPSAFPSALHGGPAVAKNGLPHKKSSQQRDCSGFSPDSLLIHSPAEGYWNKSSAKIYIILISAIKEVPFSLKQYSSEHIQDTDLLPRNSPTSSHTQKAQLSMAHEYHSSISYDYNTYNENGYVGLQAYNGIHPYIFHTEQNQYHH